MIFAGFFLEVRSDLIINKSDLKIRTMTMPFDIEVLKLECCLFAFLSLWNFWPLLAAKVAQ